MLTWVRSPEPQADAQELHHAPSSFDKIRLASGYSFLSLQVRSKRDAEGKGMKEESKRTRR